MASPAPRGVAVTAERNRLVQRGNFVPSSSIVIDVQKDAVYLHWLLELFGSLETTYASGTPVADDTSIMARVINFIKIDAGGDVVLKNINPWFFHMQSLIGQGEFNNRSCESGAAAIDPWEVDVNSKFVYGATTEFTSFAEAILISFENVLAGQGRRNTWLDARGLASLTCELTTAAYSNLQASYNVAPVVYADNNQVYFRLSTVETQQVPENANFWIWKQSQKTIQTSAAGTQRYDIVKGNYLQSIAFLCRNGSMNSAGAGLALSNSIVREMAYIINGDRYPKQTTFQQMQQLNREKYGINAPYVNGASVMDGYAYMDLLIPIGSEKLGSLDTAQNLLAPAVDSSVIELTFDAAGTYTAPAQVTMQFNEIVR